jgi:flagellar basal-body rod protein FlgG
MRSLSIASSGMLAQQTNVEVISNNIANMTTSGFKMQRAEFQDLLYQNLRRPARGQTPRMPAPSCRSGIQIGAGVKTAASLPHRRSRGNAPADFGNRYRHRHRAATAIFQVTLAQQARPPTPATAPSQLSARGPDRHLRTAIVLQPGITVPARTRTDVDHLQRLRPGAGHDLDGQTPPRRLVGQLQLATFPNAMPGSRRRATTCSSQTAASGQASRRRYPGLEPGFGTVLQGFVEGPPTSTSVERDHRRSSPPSAPTR